MHTLGLVNKLCSFSPDVFELILTERWSKCWRSMSVTNYHSPQHSVAMDVLGIRICSWLATYSSQFSNLWKFAWNGLMGTQSQVCFIRRHVGKRGRIRHVTTGHITQNFITVGKKLTWWKYDRWMFASASHEFRSSSDLYSLHACSCRQIPAPRYFILSYLHQFSCSALFCLQ